VIVNHDLHQEQHDATGNPQRQRFAYEGSRISRLAHLLPNSLKSDFPRGSVWAGELRITVTLT
jgi:hypothetical protein